LEGLRGKEEERRWEEKLREWNGGEQWPFRKTGATGTLASQAEIDVCVQAPGGVSERIRGGVLPPEKFRDCTCIYAKSCILVHFWPENGSQCHP